MNTPPPPAEYEPPPADILSHTSVPTPATESTVADTPANPEPQQETPHEEVHAMFFVNASALLEEMKKEESALPVILEQDRTAENKPETRVETPLPNPHQWDF